MAGEAKGLLAEVVAEYIIEKGLKITNGRLLYQPKLFDLPVTPDFAILDAKDNLAGLILVNYSDNARNSEMKFWRNLSEIFDVKTRVNKDVVVINLIFSSEIKQELLEIESKLADITIVMDSMSFGNKIKRWIELESINSGKTLTSKRMHFANSISVDSIYYDSDLKLSIESAIDYIAKIVFESKSSNRELWTLASAEYDNNKIKVAKQARTTYLRRGIARWLVIESKFREQVFESCISGLKITNSVPRYLIELGYLEKTIGGLVVKTPQNSGSLNETVSRDISESASFILENSNNMLDESIINLNAIIKDSPRGMIKIASDLRNLGQLIEAWHRYIYPKWQDLKDPLNMYNLLNSCHEDSTMSGEVSNAAKDRVWVYDHLIALLRTSSGRSNDFGYGSLTSVIKNSYEDSDFQVFLESVADSLDSKTSTRAKKWIKITLPKSSDPGRRGFQEWLDNKLEVNPVVIAAFSYALAHYVRQYPTITQDFSDTVSYHAYNLWNKLITYQDFEPLAKSIEEACGELVERCEVNTLLSDLAPNGIQNTGRISVLKFDGGIIYWKSATDAGRDHKRKELTARAAALKFEFTGNSYRLRSNERLILVIDGSFSKEDLKMLKDAGWGEIYYPDELDSLKNSITLGLSGKSEKYDIQRILDITGITESEIAKLLKIKLIHLNGITTDPAAQSIIDPIAETIVLIMNAAGGHAGYVRKWFESRLEILQNSTPREYILKGQSEELLFRVKNSLSGI